MSGSAPGPSPPSLDGLLMKSAQVLIGDEFQVRQTVLSSVMLPSQVNLRLSKLALSSSGEMPMLRENVPITEPFLGAAEKMKLAERKLPAPSICCGTIFGVPGTCLPK